VKILEQILSPRMSPYMALGKTGFVRLSTFITSIFLFIIAVRVLGYLASAVASGITWNMSGRPDFIDDPIMIMFLSAMYFFLTCIGALIALWVIQIWLRQRPLLDIFTSASKIKILRIFGGMMIGLGVWSLTSLLGYAVGQNSVETGLQQPAYLNPNYVAYYSQVMTWVTAGFVLIGSIIFAISFTAFTEGFIPQNLSAHLQTKWMIICLTALFSCVFYAFLAWNWLVTSPVDIISGLVFGIVVAAIVVTGRGLEYVIGLIIASSLFSEFIFSDNRSLVQDLVIFQYDGPTDDLITLVFSVLSSVLIGLIIFKIRKPVTTTDYIEDIYD